MRKAYLCGDCTVKAVEAGGKDVGGSIMYGTGCETHPELIAATHVVEIEGELPTLATREEEPASPPLEIPATVGPLTDLAVRLVSAWSSGDMTKADPNAITYAVKAARMLLKETGGL